MATRGNKRRIKFSEESGQRSSYPVKRQVRCAKASQDKLKFETKKKALNHLKWLEHDSFEPGRKPIRCYYCDSCLGWHVTSQEKRN